MSNYMAVFFAPLAFAAYCWGLHGILARFIIEPPLSYFLTAAIVIAQVGALMIAVGRTTHDD